MENRENFRARSFQRKGAAPNRKRANHKSLHEPDRKGKITEHAVERRTGGREQTGRNFGANPYRTKTAIQGLFCYFLGARFFHRRERAFAFIKGREKKKQYHERRANKKGTGAG
jgi:hypothetical protein